MRLFPKAKLLIIYFRRPTPLARQRPSISKCWAIDSQDNSEELKDALASIALDNEVTEMVDTPFGKKYIIDGDLVAPSGKRARVRTIWILETGKEVPCFVTAYPADK